eukprot:JP436752.1.p1 GENE.JP436752.1~~JP436752.1.p1  ORF type:complete len:198 (-),score=28.63 JP436752.1:11-604(-)
MPLNLQVDGDSELDKALMINDEEVSLNEIEYVSKGGSSTMFGAYFNFVNSLIGAGILGMPIVLRDAGFLLGCILLCLSGVVIDHGVVLIVDTAKKVKKHSYEELCQEAFGPAGFYICNLLVGVFASGCMVAYIIMVGDTVPYVLVSTFGESQWFSRTFIVLAVSTVLILPLSLLKNGISKKKFQVSSLKISQIDFNE